MSSGLFYHKSLDQSIFGSRGLASFYYCMVLCFIEITVVNANSVDPDQMLNSVVSDLDLHCLAITLFLSLHTKMG